MNNNISKIWMIIVREKYQLVHSVCSIVLQNIKLYTWIQLVNQSLCVILLVTTPSTYVLYCVL